MYLEESLESQKVELNIFDIVSISVAIVSFLAIGTLIGGVFSGWLVFSLLAIVFFLLGMFFRGQYEIRIPIINTSLFITLALICLHILLRMPPSLYIVGGQDQGVYVNMAAYYQNHGGIKPFDHVRDKLIDEELPYYDSTNLLNDDQQVLGVTIGEQNKSERFFEFFALHPAWMALFGEVFGKANSVYSLLFFSVLSLLSIRNLTLIVFKNESVSGYIALILVSVNPYHVFFSKFPVSEMLSIFLLTGSLYYFVKGYYAADRREQVFYFLLHALLLISQALNHISTIFFLPLLWLLLIVLDHKKCKSYKIIYPVIIIGISISMAIGYAISPWYTKRIYTQIFSIKLVQDPTIFILVVAAISCFMPLVIVFSNKIWGKWQHKLKLTALIFLFILVGAWVNRFITIINKRMILDQISQGQAFFKYLDFATIKVFIMMLSPIGFILLVLGIKKYVISKNNGNGLKTILIVILTYFSIIRLYMVILSGYSYYYSRYLLPELFPLAIVLISGYLVTLYKNGKSILPIILIAGIFCWNIFFALLQFNKTEMHLVAPTISNLVEDIDDDDVLIYHQFEESVDARTPLLSLRYFFDLSVIKSDDYQQTLTNLPSVVETYNDIYFLTKQPINNPDINLLNTATYSISHFEHVQEAAIPRWFIQPINYKIYLYKLEKS